MKAETLARMFHETYERLAPSYGYKTREASAKPWADVPETNKSLMRAVAQEILDAPVDSEGHPVDGSTVRLPVTSEEQEDAQQSPFRRITAADFDAAFDGIHFDTRSLRERVLAAQPSADRPDPAPAPLIHPWVKRGSKKYFREVESAINELIDRVILLETRSGLKYDHPTGTYVPMEATDPEYLPDRGEPS